MRLLKILERSERPLTSNSLENIKTDIKFQIARGRGVVTAATQLSFSTGHVRLVSVLKTNRLKTAEMRLRTTPSHRETEQQMIDCIDIIMPEARALVSAETKTSCQRLGLLIAGGENLDLFFMVQR